MGEEDEENENKVESWVAFEKKRVEDKKRKRVKAKKRNRETEAWRMLGSF
jgi:uncharacterized protein YbaA (DUF1428 family)